MLSHADFMSESSGKAFLGFGTGDIDYTPIVFGADYRFKVNSVAFLDDNNLSLLGGFLYWSETEKSLDFSIFEISSGVEKSLDFGKYFINFGGRFGFASIKVSASVPFVGNISDTDTRMFIAPYGEFLYPINNNMAVGGEVRLPIYLGNEFDLFDIIYFLGSFNYIF